MRSVTLVYSYWENPGMLREHIKAWNSYPDHFRAHLQVIVTDDCSKDHPAAEVFEHTETLFDHKVYYIEKKIPWNWRMARNVGARHADHRWILLTDMDHLVPPSTIHAIMADPLSENEVYQFERVDAPHFTPYKPHNDSYLMTKDRFWEIGGYDEDFAGTYGTADWPPPSYGRKVKAVQKRSGAGITRLGVPLVRYPREIVADASVPRDRLILKGPENDRKKAETIAMKKQTGRGIMTFQSPYKRVL